MAREMKDSGIEWIGEIPRHWDVRPIKNSFSIVSGSTPDSDKAEYWEGDIPWITPADFKTIDKYTSGGSRFITEKGYDSCSTNMIPKGSIIFSKRAPIGSVVINKIDLCTNQGCLSCIKNDKTDSAYFYYLMSIYDDVFNLFGSGTTFKEISATTFGDFILPLPPLVEQQLVSSFLDSKCAEIDKAVEATKASIEEYKKLRQAIITEAVTKGLDPNVEMNDSGIEWIGEIPKHWDVTKIGKSFSLRDEKNFKSEDGTQLLSLYTGRGVFPTGDEGTINSGNHAQTVIGYKVVKKDDIVVNIILAWMGAIGISEYDGVVSPAYDVYIPNKNIVCPRFCHYLFRTTGIANECYRYGRGIMMMRWRTYSPEFKQIRIPLPPIREQMKIASYLDTKCSEIDSLIKSKEKLIEELTAYRKSLIFEYVTGKKEVPAV